MKDKCHFIFNLTYNIYLRKKAFEELGNCQGKYLLEFIIRDKNITSQYSQVRTQRVISAKVMLVTL